MVPTNLPLWEEQRLKEAALFAPRPAVPALRGYLLPHAIPQPTSDNEVNYTEQNKPSCH